MSVHEPGEILRTWSSRRYLDFYYGHEGVPDDEWAMFRFMARGLRSIGKHFQAGLDLGCGPVLHHASQLVPWVDRLDMAELQETNLEEIRKWLRNDPDAFDWSIYIGGAHGALEAEEGRGGTLAEREALMRSRIHLIHCDLRDDHPLGKPSQYDLVASFYCCEWVIPSLEGWRETMRKVGPLVAPDGWFFLMGVHATEYCLMNGVDRVPCARVTDRDIRAMLEELGFERESIVVDVTPGMAPDVSGIQGTFMASAHKPPR